MGFFVYIFFKYDFITTFFLGKKKNNYLSYYTFFYDETLFP